jgi:hypothetical protein
VSTPGEGGGRNVSDVTLTTDEDGRFEAEISFEDASVYAITASFAGDNVYIDSLPAQAFIKELGATDLGPLYKGSARTIRHGTFPVGRTTLWWVWTLIGLGTLVVAALLVRGWMGRRQKKGVVAVAASEPSLAPAMPLLYDGELEEEERAVLDEQAMPHEAVMARVVQDEATPASAGGSSRIEIRFPQIVPQLPDVWGVGEPLTVVCRLPETQATGTSRKPLRIEVEDVELLPVVTDSEGDTRANPVFDTEGTHWIKVTGPGPGGRQVSARRGVRIVYYGEEIVRLFNEMLSRLDVPGLDISSEMTAREIESRMAAGLANARREAISDVVSGFEEANYSLHPVSRASYETMYTAVTEVMDRVA